MARCCFIQPAEIIKVSAALDLHLRTAHKAMTNDVCRLVNRANASPACPIPQFVGLTETCWLLIAFQLARNALVGMQRRSGQKMLLDTFDWPEFSGEKVSEAWADVLLDIDDWPEFDTHELEVQTQREFNCAAVALDSTSPRLPQTVLESDIDSFHRCPYCWDADRGIGTISRTVRTTRYMKCKRNLRGDKQLDGGCGKRWQVKLNAAGDPVVVVAKGA
jgi:hypothetical protein